jgi:hypothetical protein
MSAHLAAAPRPSGSPNVSMPPRARFIVSAAGAMVGVGLLLALVVPILGLSSGDCGPLSCGLVQTVGKGLTAGGLGIGFGVVAVGSFLTRRYSAGTVAALIAIPALLMAATVVEQWRLQSAGVDEATQVLTAARQYAASRGIVVADGQAVVFNGRGTWLSVKLTAPDGSTAYVLERRDGPTWTPQAMAPTFTRDELRALGAPTDLLRDPS